MKNNVLFYIIISVFCFNSFAQKQKAPLDGKKTKSVEKSQIVSTSTKTIKSYHVEENIKMNFGGYTTTYNVSDPSLINTNDLGPNNKRVVTQRFTKVEPLIVSPKEAIKDSLTPSLKPIYIKPSDSLRKKGDYAYVTMIKTYERVAEKGYKSVDIFQKLGNAFYFNDELGKAARWYGELFAMTSDLEPEYYYRYSSSLKAIGENEKANEMLEKFNQLSRNTSK